MRLIKIPLHEGYRIVRIGGGKHAGKWFFRIDLWWIGFRITQTPPKKDTQS